MSSIFGWSYPAGAANDPSAPYNQDEQPVMLNEGKTLPGYGSADEGLNGKDGDLHETGQCAIEEAWWFGESIRCVLTCYATICPPEDETKDAQPYVSDLPFSGEWTGDDWSITTGEIVIEFPTEAETEEQAQEELLAAINTDPTVQNFEVEIGGLNRMLDAWYNETE